MIAMIGGLAIGAAKTLVLSTMTEKMILKLTFMLLEWVVKQTTNSVDNKILLAMQERHQEDGIL